MYRAMFSVFYNILDPKIGNFTNLRILFVFVGVMHSGEYDVCGVPLSGASTTDVDALSEECHNHSFGPSCLDKK